MNSLSYRRRSNIISSRVRSCPRVVGEGAVPGKRPATSSTEQRAAPRPAMQSTSAYHAIAKSEGLVSPFSRAASVRHVVREKRVLSVP